MLITSVCNNIENTNKNVNHTSKVRTGQYLFLFHHCYYLKILLKWKQTLLCQKNLKTKHLTIKYQQRGIKRNTQKTKGL